MPRVMNPKPVRKGDWRLCVPERVELVPDKKYEGGVRADLYVRGKVVASFGFQILRGFALSARRAYDKAKKIGDPS